MGPLPLSATSDHRPSIPLFGNSHLTNAASLYKKKND